MEGKKDITDMFKFKNYREGEEKLKELNFKLLSYYPEDSPDSFLGSFVYGENPPKRPHPAGPCRIVNVPEACAFLCNDGRVYPSRSIDQDMKEDLDKIRNALLDYGERI